MKMRPVGRLFIAALVVALLYVGGESIDAQKHSGVMPSTILYVEDEVGLCWAHFFTDDKWVDVEPIACTPRVLAFLDKHPSILR
ncbi:MAG: hypothetical protein AAB458_01350 [Patescibacteria group bacterium]